MIATTRRGAVVAWKLYTGAEWSRVVLQEDRFETRLFRVVPELQFSL